METSGSSAARFMLLASLLFCTHCSIEESLNTAVVNCSIRLNGTSAMDGKIIVGNAYLHLTQLDLRAGTTGKEATRFSHTIPAEEPPLMLTGSDERQPVSVYVTPGTYDPVQVTLHLFQDNYELVIINEGNDDDNGDNGNNDGGEDKDDDDGDRDHDDDDRNNDDDDDSGYDDGDRDHDDDDSGHDNDDSGHDDDDSGHDDDDSGHDNDDSGHDDDDSGHDNDDRGQDDGDSGHDNDDRDRDDDDRDRDDDKDNEDGNKGKGKGKDKDKDKDKDDDDDKDGDGRSGDNTATHASVDFADFLLHAKPAIVLLGTYENGDRYFAIFLAIDNIATVSFTGTENGSSTITLDNLQTAELLFDVEQWFASITPDQMESASRQVYQEQEVVLIHKDFNKPLYNAIVEKIEASGRLIFNAPAE